MLPEEIPLIKPLLPSCAVTVAIAGLSDVHVTALISGSFGLNVAFTVVSLSSYIDTLALSRITLIFISSNTGSMIRSFVTAEKSVSHELNV